MNEVDRAEQRRQAAERLTEVLAGSTGTAEHPSGMAVATATASGELTWLRLHPHALGHGPRAVGQLVVETAKLATDAAVQHGYNELAKSLGDSVAIAIEGFAGPPPFRTAADAAGQAPYTDAPPQQGAQPMSPQPHGFHGEVQPAFRTDEQPPYGGTIEPPAEPPPARPFAPAPQPPAQAGRKPRPPVDDDDDAYFADPFGTGGFRP
ncbi:YbaB/EbfC family nucleoid-associated protein [Umezawaea endophytica]|uniref:YbaB/EbfC family nucleoid-associated protein n=1 Tax=Umezawaea endophytica TaxID=1654476 RepID=A0A9X2VYW5_9PSEU|nr:YbaB/EbfC family nucleoid-associated protein [Umezawaea endophytica]MCS7484283.1 YbaB/EbfC family nucleoid-associated protein [Umezawaea endophytica]